MQTSIAGISLIKHFESLRLISYQDQASVWTIGYGTTVINGIPVQANMKCTEAEAVNWLTSDVVVFEKHVARLTDGPLHIKPKQCEFDALVSFAYNVGQGALAVSTLLKKFNAGIEVLEKNFTDWNKINIKGKLVTSAGLIRRRKAEFTLFREGRVQFIF